MNVPSPKRVSGVTAVCASLALVAAFASGCSDPYATICERGATCAAANDLAIDACVIEQQSREDVAAIYGCDQQWNDYVDCMVDNGTCSGDKLSGCDTLKDAWKRCVP